MKFVTSLAVVLAVQSAIPATALMAAPVMNIDGDRHTRTRAFAGARFRLALGGQEAGRTRLGLTLAPTRQNRWSEGRQSLAFAEGLEFGVVSGEPLAARIAGRRLTGLRPVGGPALGTGEPRLGVSTLAMPASPPA